MILKRLKEKSVYKIIKRNVPLPPPVTADLNSVLFVVDAEKNNNFEALKQLAKALNIKNDKVFFAGYLEKPVKGTDHGIPVFTDKNLDWKGGFKSNTVSFLPEKVDLLVNFYQSPSAALLAISFAVKAGFRVGVGQNSLFNHLTVETKDLNEKSFVDEVLKYINILNKK